MTSLFLRQLPKVNTNNHLNIIIMKNHECYPINNIAMSMSSMLKELALLSLLLRFGGERRNDFRRDR